MAAAEKTTDEAGEQSWDLSFSAVELKESASLGGDVRVEIAPRTTVLVGKNGAGKSLLVEKMQAAIWGAVLSIQTGGPHTRGLPCESESCPQKPTGKAPKRRL